MRPESVTGLVGVAPIRPDSIIPGRISSNLAAGAHAERFVFPKPRRAGTFHPLAAAVTPQRRGLAPGRRRPADIPTFAPLAGSGIRHLSGAEPDGSWAKTIVAAAIACAARTRWPLVPSTFRIRPPPPCPSVAMACDRLNKSHVRRNAEPSVSPDSTYSAHAAPPVNSSRHLPRAGAVRPSVAASRPPLEGCGWQSPNSPDGRERPQRSLVAGAGSRDSMRAPRGRW